MFSTASQNAQPQNRTAFDMSDRDFSDHMAPVAGSGGLYVQFSYMRVRLSTGEWSTRLVVIKQPKGDRSTVAVRFISKELAAQQFPQEFAQFMSTGEVPTAGTPLSELPGISMAQIGLLYVHGIRSIEDAAALTDGQISQIGIDAIQAQKVARRWLDKRDGNADDINSAKREAGFEAALMDRDRQLADLTRTATELAAQVRLLQQMGVSVAKPAGEMVPGMVAAQALQGAIAVEGQEFTVLNAAGAEEFMGGSDMADGNGDLGLDAPPPSMENPLGLSSSRKK